MASAVNSGSINMPKILRQIKHRTKQVKDLVFIRDPIFRKNVKTRKADVVTELAGPPVSFGYTQGGQNSFDTVTVIDDTAGSGEYAGRKPDVVFHIDSPPLVIPDIMAFQSPIESGGDLERSGFRKSGTCKFYIPSFEQLKQANPLFNAAQFTDFEPYDKFIERDKVIYSHPEISITEKKSISIPLNSPVMATAQDYDYIDYFGYDLVDYLEQEPVFSSGGISGIEIDRVQFKIKVSGSNGLLERISYFGHSLAGERRPSYSGDGNNRPYGYGHRYQIINPMDRNAAGSPDAAGNVDTDGNAFSYNCFHEMLFTTATRPLLKQDEWFTVDVAVPKDVGSKERISQKESMTIIVNTSDKTKFIDQFVVIYDSIKWGGSEINRAGAAQGTGDKYCFWFQVDGSQTAPTQTPSFCSITCGSVKAGDIVSIGRHHSSIRFQASATGSESGDDINRYFQFFTTSTVASEASITFLLALSNGNTVTIIDTAGTSKTYTVAAGDTDASAGTFAGDPAGGMNGLADGLAQCIAHANGHNGTITTSATATGKITLTQAVAGTGGNTTITRSGWGDSSGTISQWSSPSATEKTADALEAAINTHKSSLTTTRMSNSGTIILTTSPTAPSNSYIGIYPSNAGYTINQASHQYTTVLGFYGGSNSYSNTIEVDISGTAAAATITITNYAELNTGDKVNLIATDTTNYDFTNGDQSSVAGTWESTTSNDVTATNLMNAINTSSGPSGTRFTATVSGAVVTVTQATGGVDGNTTVTLTDAGTAGMSKTNFTGGADTDDEGIATALTAAINTQTGIFTAVATLPVVGKPSVKPECVVPNPIGMGYTHFVSFGLIDRAVAYDGYLRIEQVTSGAGLAGGEFIEGPFTDENIYVTFGNIDFNLDEPTTAKLGSLWGAGGFDLARMHASSEFLSYLPGYYERTGLTHFYIELANAETFKIKDLKFYKANEWRIDSVKKYSEEYTVINAVQVRGGRDSRRRAYGGETRGDSKELGVHG